MVYSTVIQTYMCDGGDMYIIGGRRWLPEKKSSTPPPINSNSFLLSDHKNVLNCAIINKKHISNYLINKANIKLSYISESITMIIGKLINRPLCLVCGVQRAILVSNT